MVRLIAIDADDGGPPPTPLVAIEGNTSAVCRDDCSVYTAEAEDPLLIGEEFVLAIGNALARSSFGENEGFRVDSASSSPVSGSRSTTGRFKPESRTSSRGQSWPYSSAVTGIL